MKKLMLVPAVALCIAGLQAGPQPENLRLPGLSEPVTVRRDDRGIPYIEARSERDLFVAQGFVAASDRLWQMDLLRRSSRGELAEIFGRAALEEDKRHRRLGFARTSELQAASARAATKSILEWYALGVNAFIESRDEKSLPVEFRILRYKPRLWKPADTLAVGLLMAESLSTTWRTDVFRASLADLPAAKRQAILPEVSPLDVIVVGSDKTARASIRPAAPAVDPRAARSLLALVAGDARIERATLDRAGLFAEGLAASNNWVVGGKRSVTGKPLLANDPHLAPSTPSIWHMVHLGAPGYRVAGVTFPGTPGVILGHNQRIAWGATNLAPDVQDLYREHFDPDDPRRYRTPGGWADAEVRREPILVRKNPMDPAVETVDFEVVSTRNGPVILEGGEGTAPGKYTLRWTALSHDRDFASTFLMLDRARNWKEFCEALKTYPGPTQNFVYADVEGNFGYYGAGAVPLRRRGDGSVPYDGRTDEGDWTGTIPFERLPHVLNPAAGMVVTANNRIVGTDYPFHLTHEWSEPYRARRISDLLAAKAKLSVEDIAAIQADIYSIAGKAFARDIVDITRGAGGDGTDLAALESWDGRFNGESTAALLVSEIRAALRTRLLEAVLGEAGVRAFRWMNSGTFVDTVMRTRDTAWLPPGTADFAELVKACVRDARETLTKRLGGDESKWIWGSVTASRWWRHPLANAPFVGSQFRIPHFPAGGNGGLTATVNVGPAVSMRLIADPSNWDNTRQHLAPGNSGDPAGPHWADQLDDWRTATPRVFPFSEAAVRSAARSVQTLTP